MLFLPNAENVYVAEKKILGYLLSQDHVDGASKAEFFLSFGFTRENWEVLAEALKHHGTSYLIQNTVQSEYGTLYVIEGDLVSPDGRNPRVRSVWMIDRPDVDNVFAGVPRLISAYPD